MDIDLEKFTNNSNHMSKEIYEFCGLKWSEKVLEFYKETIYIVKHLVLRKLETRFQSIILVNMSLIYIYWKSTNKI